MENKEPEEEYKFLKLTRLLTKTEMLNDNELQNALLKNFHREGPTALKCKVSWSEDKSERQAVVEFENKNKAEKALRRWDGKNSFTVDYRGIGAELIDEPIGWVKAKPSEQVIYRPVPKAIYPERSLNSGCNGFRNTIRNSATVTNASGSRGNGRNQSGRGSQAQRNVRRSQNIQQNGDNWNELSKQPQQRRSKRGWEEQPKNGMGMSHSGSNRRKPDDGWGVQNTSSRDGNEYWVKDKQRDNWDENHKRNIIKENDSWTDEPNRRHRSRNDGRNNHRQSRRRLPPKSSHNYDQNDEGWDEWPQSNRKSISAENADDDWDRGNRGKPHRRQHRQSSPRTNNHNEGWGPGPTHEKLQSRPHRASRNSTPSRSNRRPLQRDEGWSLSRRAANEGWGQKQNVRQQREHSDWDSPQEDQERRYYIRDNRRRRNKEECQDDGYDEHSSQQYSSKRSVSEGRIYPKRQNRDVVNKSYTPGKHKAEGRRERSRTPTLPPKWNRAFCPKTDRPYYWHSITKKVQWQIPVAEGIPPPPPDSIDGRSARRHTQNRHRGRPSSKSQISSSRRYDE